MAQDLQHHSRVCMRHHHRAMPDETCPKLSYRGPRPRGRLRKVISPLHHDGSVQFKEQGIALIGWSGWWAYLYDVGFCSRKVLKLQVGGACGVPQEELTASTQRNGRLIAPAGRSQLQASWPSKWMVNRLPK